MTDAAPLTVDSIDVPQQDDLGRVRALVRALRDAVPVAGLGAAAGLSRRHVRYTLHAARTLGFASIEGDVWTCTAAGANLLGTTQGSDAERGVLRAAVEHNRVVSVLAPDLFATQPPSLDTLAQRLMANAGLSGSTAQRRAMTLLAWREQTNEPETRSRLSEPRIVIQDDGQYSLF